MPLKRFKAAEVIEGTFFGLEVGKGASESGERRKGCKVGKLEKGDGVEEAWKGKQGK